MSKPKSDRPYIYKGKKRKYLYEHVCLYCEQGFLSTMPRKNFCPTCIKDSRRVNAALQVRHNLHRAKRVGLPSKLTAQQWLAIINDFSWKCAYCQLRPYSLLEHYIPINLGGGTTPDNVLPSCRSCNSIKSSYHPEQVFESHTIQRVTFYLQAKQVESEVVA
jgi:5-methylcytosine-specific restriction endonuclease McrA